MISKDDVQHIAKLARIQLTKKEEEQFQKDLSSILDYFDTLKKCDVSKVEPTFHPTASFLERHKTMRTDVVLPKPAGLQEKLLKATPETEKGYVKVKGVLQ